MSFFFKQRIGILHFNDKQIHHYNLYYERDEPFVVNSIHIQCCTICAGRRQNSTAANLICGSISIGKDTRTRDWPAATANLERFTETLIGLYEIVILKYY